MQISVNNSRELQIDKNTFNFKNHSVTKVDVTADVLRAST